MNFKGKLLLKLIIIVVFLLLLFYIFIGIKKEEHIENKQSANKSIINILNEVESINNNSIKVINNIAKDIPNDYKGYRVGSRLEIPSIQLETYVLAEYSKQGLDICVSKFWGAEPNEIGNYCIAGHNYNKENMFFDLYKLEIGDMLEITDNTNGTIKYEIYDIYKVKPENTECLSQDTNGKREVTLITCTQYATYRLIIKAKEV